MRSKHWAKRSERAKLFRAKRKGQLVPASMDDLNNMFNMMGLSDRDVSSLVDSQKNARFVCSKCGVSSIEDTVLFREGCMCMVCIRYNPMRSRVCARCFANQN